MSKIDLSEIKNMDILLYLPKGNYRIIPTEYERDYILTFLRNNRNEQKK